MYQLTPSFEYFFFYFLQSFLLISLISLSFDLFEPCTVLLLLCHRPYCFRVSIFCTFSDAVKAGYREYAKAHSKHCYANTANGGSRFRWISVIL